MAEDTGRRRATTPAADEERADTKRLVLKREHVLVLPDGLDNGVVKAAQEVIRKADKSAGSGLATTAWVEVGEFAGSKTTAIEAHAGKANTPDAKPGAYKAPSVSAMRGGLLYEKPPEPKVERKALD